MTHREPNPICHGRHCSECAPVIADPRWVVTKMPSYHEAVAKGYVPAAKYLENRDNWLNYRDAGGRLNRTEWDNGWWVNNRDRYVVVKPVSLWDNLVVSPGGRRTWRHYCAPRGANTWHDYTAIRCSMCPATKPS